MNDSLSVILSVFDAQATLARRVSEILEVLPELTSDFEVLIVDDGSGDATEEVAHELSLTYPQVRFVRHSRRRGMEAVLETGLLCTHGEIVFIQSEDSPLSQSDLHQLWEIRHDEQLVLAQGEPRPTFRPSKLIERLVSWGAALRRSSRRRAEGGIQMVRRAALTQSVASEASSRPLAIERIARTDTAADSEATRRGPNFLARLKRFALSE